jgi:hypothetical protein
VHSLSIDRCLVVGSTLHRSLFPTPSFVQNHTPTSVGIREQHNLPVYSSLGWLFTLLFRSSTYSAPFIAHSANTFHKRFAKRRSIPPSDSPFLYVCLPCFPRSPSDPRSVKLCARHPFVHHTNVYRRTNQNGVSSILRLLFSERSSRRDRYGCKPVAEPL